MIDRTLKSHLRLTTACRLAALVLVAVACLLALPAPARADRFPTTGDFNGLSITYSISGAQLGIQWTRKASPPLVESMAP